jgi:putative acetyltransferase
MIPKGHESLDGQRPESTVFHRIWKFPASYPQDVAASQDKAEPRADNLLRFEPRSPRQQILTLATHRGQITRNPEVTMPLTIAAESPLTADGRRLIDGSQAALLDVFSPDEIFTFSPEELATPDVTFLVARDEDRALACVAMVDCGPYVEVKRLYVPAEGRGRGLARAMMADLETRARTAGKAQVMLETGDALVPAVALYKTLGYRVRGPFGDYPAHPASLFMEKAL